MGHEGTPVPRTCLKSADIIMSYSITPGPQGFPTHYMVRDVRIEPNVVLAPMEGVTDVIFRRVIRELGGAGLTYTEFIASRGIVHNEKRSWNMASFDPDERPVALQIFGRNPQWMAEAAKQLEDAGATIIDINMGCPAKKVCQKSGGSALMKDPELAAEIVRAVRSAIKIPLTVKMRSGFDATQRNAPELCKIFESEGAEGLTIHWRTRADLYGGERAVDKIAEAVQTVNIPVIANGDVIDVASARKMFEDTGCAGVMLGRGAIRDPWSLLHISQWLRGDALTPITSDERERVLMLYYDRIQEHFEAADQGRRTLGRVKMMIRHFAEPLPHGKELRHRVCRAATLPMAREITQHYFEVLRTFERGDLNAFVQQGWDVRKTA